MLGAKYLSGHKLSRLNVLSSLVSCILITDKSELRQMALDSAKRTQFASRVKQMKRWLLNEHVDYQTYYLPFVEPLLKTLSVSGELVFSIDGSVVGKGCIFLGISPQKNTLSFKNLRETNFLCMNNIRDCFETCH